MHARTVLTYDDLQAVPEDGLRRELIGGDLYVSPAPSPLHQRVVGAILVALHTYARSQGGEAFTSPIDVVFSPTDVAEPDVLYLRPERLGLIGPKNIQGAPSLVVEVISPSSSDVDPGPKLKMYGKHAVPEYWIVDPVARVITAHADPHDGVYTRSSASVDGTIDALTLADFRFTVPAESGPTT
jgi:Uma2 family endonuclease